ncbi:PPE domain-containing protein [Nocardia paucivorans]|uniref:PPE domain-containing protein n=1 Tax=Nocardia paucivorans TaxID=114259 RepID=UPI0002DF0EE4|nr:PPE domain-containing protein [Nocardia paucivorans]
MLDPIGVLATIGRGLNYFATSPLKHRLDLMSGAGAAPLELAANGYRAMAAGLRLAAEGSDGSMANMEVSWQGEAGDKARMAFRRHANWLREQAMVADEMAKIADSGAAAYRAADAGVPPLAAILANIARRAALGSAVAVGGPTLGLAATAAYAAAEAEWLAMQMQAGVAMSAYDAATETLAAAIPNSVPPPPITTGPGGETVSVTNNNTLLTTTTPKNPTNNPVTKQIVGDRSGPTGKPGGDITDPGKSVSDPSGPTTSEAGSSVSDAVSDAVQSAGSTDPGLNELEQAMQPFDQVLPDGGYGGYGNEGVEGYDLLGQEHLLGTSPYSTTLMGLTGGTGSLVALGMVNGGLGNMSGAATGFRMPPNWNLGSGTAFGAGTGVPAGTPAGSSAPRRGVSAPTARMRRRRKDEESNKPSKVFVPGEAHDVPVLERPPAIGVIEYDDDDRWEDEAREDVLVGVLDRFDEENDPALSERPR